MFASVPSVRGHRPGRVGPGVLARERRSIAHRTPLSGPAVPLSRKAQVYYLPFGKNGAVRT